MFGELAVDFAVDDDAGLASLDQQHCVEQGCGQAYLPHASFYLSVGLEGAAQRRLL